MEGVDPRSGYCARTSIYHSILAPAELPSHPTDLTTYSFASKRADAALGRTVAVVDGRTGRNLTFSQLDETVRKVAAGLWQRLAIRKSDVVAILSPNSIEFGVLFFAIASLGAITTTLNPLNTIADIKKLIRGAGTKFLSSPLALLPSSRDLTSITPGDGQGSRRRPQSFTGSVGRDRVCRKRQDSQH